MDARLVRAPMEGRGGKERLILHPIKNSSPYGCLQAAHACMPRHAGSAAGEEVPQPAAGAAGGCAAAAVAAGDCAAGASEEAPAAAGAGLPAAGAADGSSSHLTLTPKFHRAATKTDPFARSACRYSYMHEDSEYPN